MVREVLNLAHRGTIKGQGGAGVGAKSLYNKKIKQNICLEAFDKSFRDIEKRYIQKGAYRFLLSFFIIEITPIS